MTSINKVILIGRVGQEPEIKSFDTREIANFSMATSEIYKNKDGEKVSKTYWHKISVTSPGLVNLVKNYVHKGAQIYIEGQLKTREWENKEGVKQIIVEVVLGPYKGNLMLLGDWKQNPEVGDYEPAKKTLTINSYDSTPTYDDEIPF